MSVAGKRFIEWISNSKRDVRFLLITDWPGIFVEPQYTFNGETKEDILLGIAKLRSLQKSISWRIRMVSGYSLESHDYFADLISSITNGDVLTITYNPSMHEDFIILMENVKLYRMSAIYLHFNKEILMDIVQFVNDLMKTYVYYCINDGCENTYKLFEE